MLCYGQRIQVFESEKCSEDNFFVNVLKPEIASKAANVNRIIQMILNSNEQNKTYEELALFVDTFGGRQSGSEALENSTNYLVKKLENENLDNVYTEEVLVPNWKRGAEWARMVEPRRQPLAILGLAGSVSTPDDGVTAQVIVFNSLKDISETSEKLIKNRIVLFNTNHINGSYIKFKLDATRTVADAGGLAVIFKSHHRETAYMPRAGIIRYYSKDTQIPAASIAAEDSDLLYRISRRGVKVVVNLYLESKFHGMSESRNLIAELVGTRYPDESVIVSAHIDSFDQGQGAIDDGAGVFISWRALALINKLGLKPKRTLRLLLFTGEEMGRFGSKAYIERHSDTLQNISVIMNSDYGTFQPFGLTFSGQSPRAQCIVNEVLQLLRQINATQLVVGKSYDLMQSGADLFIKAGIPASGLLNDNSKYWHLSHTRADTISAINPYYLDLCSIVWTAASYVLADLSVKLPTN